MRINHSKGRNEYLPDHQRLQYIHEGHLRCRKSENNDHRPFQRPDHEQIVQICHNAKELSVYSNAALKSAAAVFGSQIAPAPGGILLFDKNGYLVRWYGSEQFRKWCAGFDIRIGACFQEEAAGVTAVSLGLRYNTVIHTIGTENYLPAYHELAFYFSPIDAGQTHGTQQIQGGIALLIPASENGRFLDSFLNAVVREVEIQYFWFRNIVNYEIPGSNGSIRLDQNQGHNKVVSISDGVLKLFHIRHFHFYCDLQDLLRHSPQNEKFWEIIDQQLEVRDQLITICLGGTTQRVSISSYRYNVTRFHITGLVIALTSVQKLNKMISRFTGNNAQYRFEDIVGQDPVYVSALNYARAAAVSDSHLLLMGESGVGKDILAQAIHNKSRRCDGPFVAINCAAFSKELIYSELFGYEDGAFTGARRGGNLGKFELANHGTLFLDEIGDMPLELQAVLLRVLENGDFMKVGGSQLTHVDVRIIAATNVDLSQCILNRTFREDLYYRLGALRITLPPLREHRGDIFPLADYFLEAICAKTGCPVPALTEDARRFMLSYDWPGNIRELRNALDGIVQIYNGPVIDKEHLIRHLTPGCSRMPSYEPAIISETTCPQPPIGAPRRGRKPITCNKETILETLRLCDNNRSEAARRLGLSRRTFYRKLEEYGIQ